MSEFIRQYQNAKRAVAQIRAGEWEPRYNEVADDFYSAKRGDKIMWIGNGAWFCEIKGGNYFGLLWRHYVWWAAARRMRHEAKMKRNDGNRL